MNPPAGIVLPQGGNIPSAQNGANLGVMKAKEERSRLAREAVRLRFSGKLIRAIQLDEKQNISREDFFKRYSPGLKLGPNDQITEIREFYALNMPMKYFSIHQQKYKNLPVFDSRITLAEKIEKQFVLFALTNYAANLDKLNLNLSPTLSEQDALQAAMKSLGALNFAWIQDPQNFQAPSATLGIASKDGSFSPESMTLVYRFASIPTLSPMENYQLDVDAKTGEIFNLTTLTNSNIAAEWHESVQTNGYNSRNESVSFIADHSQADNEYRLQSPSTFNSKNGIFTPSDIITVNKLSPDPLVDDPTGKIFSDSNGIFGETDENNDRLGVEIFSNAQKTLAYFSTYYYWNGPNGTRTEPLWLYLVSKVAGGAQSNGNELYFSPQASFGCFTMTALDVVAHEFTHTIVKRSSQLQYKGVSGALDESFADIFGTLAKITAKGFSPASWYFASEVCPPLGIRNLSNPKLSDRPQPNTIPNGIKGTNYIDPNCDPQIKNDPCTASDSDSACLRKKDFCGVHTNSGIANYWFYLLSEGSNGVQKNDNKESYQVIGIGKEKAADIAFYTMIGLPPTANWFDVRVLSQMIAVNAYGLDSPEFQDVLNAWHAVGNGPAYGNENDRWVSPSSTQKDVEPWMTTLSWETKPDEYAWQVEVYDTEDNKITKEANAVYPFNGKLTTSVQVALEPNTTYYWSVRAKKYDNNIALPVSGRGVQNPPSPPDWGKWENINYFTTSSKETKILAINPPPGISQNPLNYPWGSSVVWEYVPGSMKYFLQISENPFPTDDSLPALSTPTIIVNPSKPENQDGSNIKQSLNLKMNTLYYVRVAAVSPDGSFGMWSNGGVGVPLQTGSVTGSLDKPADQTHVAPWGKPLVTLSWKKTEGASSYIVDVAGKTYTVPEKQLSLPIDDIQNTVDNQSYSWKVTPVGPPVYGNLPSQQAYASNPSTFIVDSKLISAPTLTSPGNNASLDYQAANLNTTFKWNPVPGAEEYDLTVCVHMQPNTCKTSIQKTTSATIPGVQSDPSGKYAWKVRARAKGISGPYSGYFTYTINPAKTTITAPIYGAPNVEYKNLKLTWKNDYAPGGYTITVYDESANTDVVINLPVKDKFYTINLLPGHNFTFAVNTLNKDGAVVPAKGDVIKFNTKNDIPACNSQQVPGGAQADSRKISLGKTTGAFSVTYTTYTIADKIDVYYEGQLKWSSGCSSTGEQNPNDPNSPGIYLNSGPISFNGNSSKATVTVTPWCNPKPGEQASTEWAYTLNCP